MSSFKSDHTVLIASAQCQDQERKPGTGNSLCNKEHTRFIPHLMYGDPDNLQEYTGARDLASLKAFVENHKGSGSNASPPADAHEGSCPINGEPWLLVPQVVV
jgi:hypothetical protein